MSDAMTELFTAALGMQEPWRVKDVRFEPEAGTIHFDVECTASRLPCPASGSRCNWLRTSVAKPS